MALIECQKRPGCAKLIFNRPEAANAYNAEMLRLLAGHLHRLKDDDTVGAVIICSSTSRYFCAGADFRELSTRTANDGLDLLSREVFDELAEYPLPTIAAVEGAAVGGGLELALACDIRVGSSTSSYSLPETTLGLIPAAGGCRRLAEVLGPNLAKEIILFSRRLNGEDAYRRGLTNFLTAPGEALGKAEEMAAIAAAHDPLANRLAKQAINSAVSSGCAKEIEGIAQALLYSRRYSAK